jgi:FKBP-type peptidyl-prolyl cis-trans isomerase SlyD
MFDVGTLEIGMIFQVGSGEGGEVAKVVSIVKDEVVIDSNHPLAGITFNFDIKVHEAREATAEEMDARSLK